jgi:hypothetical protein
MLLLLFMQRHQSTMQRHQQNSGRLALISGGSG